MKKITTHQIFKTWIVLAIVMLGGMLAATAQTPGIPYQAYIVDVNGGNIPGEQIEVPLANTQILLEFEIRNDMGEVEYIEQKTVTTDEYGMVSTIVGIDGTPVEGSFADIDWNGKTKKLDVDIDFSATGSQLNDHSEMDIIYIPIPGGDAALSGLSSGTGAPTDAAPADPTAGDVYVDDATGDLYTFDGTDWNKQSGTNVGTGEPTMTGAPGDIYVEEGTGDVYTYDGVTWKSQSDVVSTNPNNLVTEDTNGLAFLDEAALKAASGLSSGSGTPDDGTDDPADPQAGDIYVDEATGDVYTYADTDGDGTADAWTSQQSDVVSADADNLVEEGADGLAYLDAEAVEAASGVSSGTGTPDDGTDDPVDPQAGDIYVDEATGDVYTYDGNAWESQAETLTSLAVMTNDNGTPADATDDFNELTYVDEEGESHVINLASVVLDETVTALAVTTNDNGTPADATDDYDQLVYTNELNVDNAIDLTGIIAAASGTSSGSGTPDDGTDDPVDPQAGDIYVDEATGDVYTYADTDGDGTADAWTSQSDIVSALDDNIITEDIDGLAFLDEAAVAAASGTSSGSGVPDDGTDDPVDPQAGDIYVDEATGDVYTYADTDGDGTADAWTSQSDIVSALDDNIITEDTDGLAFLDEAAVAAASGTSSGSGAPDDGTDDPVDPQAGDIYVDEATGDVYTYDGAAWTSQSDIVSALNDNIITEDTDGLAFLDEAAVAAASGTSSGSGAPNDGTDDPVDPQAGDIYVDEATGDVYTYDGATWTSQSDIVSADADNLVEEGTDGLAYLDAEAVEAASGLSSGVGAPTDTAPADPQAGDIYVDEATGDVYTYDGAAWTSQSDIVSVDADNLVEEGTDGLAFLDAEAVEAASGLSSGVGAPTDTAPADPQAGDVYIDEATGDVYTYDGAAWTSQSDIVSADADNLVEEGTDGLAYLDAEAVEAASGLSSGVGAPTDTAPADPQAGDVYIDEATGDVYTYDGAAWTSQSDIVSVDADNLVEEGTDGLAYLDVEAVEAASGLSSGVGAPTDTAPADPQAGDVYIDEATGDVYTYDGAAWTSQSDIVSADADNLVEEGTDGLAFLDAAAVGLTTGTGDPTTAGVTGAAGDIYVDEATGDVYTYDGATWTSQSDIVSADADNLVEEGTDGLAFLDAAAVGLTTGTGDPTTAGVTGAAGDIYVDEATGDVYTYDGATWSKPPTVATGAADNTLRWDGTAWVTSAALTNDGTDVTATGNVGAATSSTTGDATVGANLAVTGTATVATLAAGDIATDEIVTATAAGLLQKVPVANIVREPWFGTDDDAAATDNTEAMYVDAAWVGIGVTDPSSTGGPTNTGNGERLYVNGSIRSASSIYADYVLEDYAEGTSSLNPTYKRASLDDVDEFVRANKHLPGVTSIKDLPKTEDGKYSIDMTTLSIQSLEKIEELYLYTIEQQKQIEQQTKRIELLLNRIEALENKK